MGAKWNVTLMVYRQKGGAAPYYDEFRMEADPDEYVLDAVERIWAFHDRSLCFSHACHHSTCGACGMRINGLEKLTCITPIRDVVSDGGAIKVEPLRNFPVLSDLVVDMGLLFIRMEQVGHLPVVPVSEEPTEHGDPRLTPALQDDSIRLSDCIECGLCISACPIATTTLDYLGPAVLAGAYQKGINGNRNLLSIVDSADGVWRCHHAYECTEVCPSYVEPGTKIMDLRKLVIRERIRGLLGSRYTG